MKYDAFISYRHCEPDMEIAKRVHAGLENFKVPSSVQKRSQKSRIRRVFRDQEELPIGSDLSESIATALYNSEFLVVICSPRTMESEWVMKEIDTFISMHGRENILAVLVEGEPWQSFPRQLLTDDYGNVIEPLAADVRGENRRDRKEKLKSELMRLAAPILGCSYDDLRQRHREQKLRRTMGKMAAILGSVAAVAAGFGVYYAMVANQMKQLANEKTQLAEEKELLADEMVALNYELEDAYKEQLKNQSSYLAATAESLFEEGNREDAVLVSIEALPSEYNDRPYLPEVEYGLSNYLYAYECGDEINFDRTLTHEMPVSCIDGSKSGEYIATIDSVGATYIWKTKTGERLLKIDPELSSTGANIKPLAIAIDENNLYIASEEGFMKYDFSGELMYKVDPGFKPQGAEIYVNGGLAFAKYNTELVVIDITDGSIEADINSTADINYGTRFAYNNESGYAAISHYEFLGEKTGITIIDCKNGYNDTYIPLEGYEVQVIDITDSGKVTAVVSYDNGFGFLSENNVNAEIVALDCASAEMLWKATKSFTINYTSSYWTVIDNRTFTDSAGVVEQTIVSMGSTLVAYNTETGALMCTSGMSGNVSDIILYDGVTWGMVMQTNGNVDYVDFTNGAIYADKVLVTGKAIVDVWENGDVYAIRASSDKDITILSYHSASDLETLVDSAEGKGGLLSPNEDYIVTYGDASTSQYTFYGVDGSYLGAYEMNCWSYTAYIGFNADNEFVMVDDTANEIHWYNPFDRSSYSIKLFQGYSNGLLILTDSYYTRNRRYALYRNSYYYSVVDLIDKKEIYSAKSDDSISGAAVSEDGSTVYLGYINAPFRTVDIATDTVTEYDELNLNVISTSKENIVVSDDGGYIAVNCKDAFVRTVDLDAREITAEMEVYSTNNCYISFLASTYAVLVHCNDELINVIYADSGVTYSQISVEVKDIKSLAYDWELGYYVVTAANGVTLLEEDGFKPVACATKGLGYVTSTHTFILRSGKKIYSAQYKDYNQLIQEAGEQFPGAELTPEEMAMYNIY